MEQSPLRRLAALRGASADAAEASIALWTVDDRALLVRIGLLDRECALTPAGRDVLRCGPEPRPQSAAQPDLMRALKASLDAARTREPRPQDGEQ